MKKLNCLLALVGGTAIGVITGMLVAPNKGAETRCKIKHLMRKQKHFAKEHIVEFLKNKGITISDEELNQLFHRCNCECDCETKQEEKSQN